MLNIIDITKTKQWVVEQVLWAENNLKDKTGAEKKAAIVKKLDDMITLPAYLEWADDAVISWLVDQACDKLNGMTAHSFGDVELNDVDKNKVAESLKSN